MKSFTLIEMLISISIMAILTSVIILNPNKGADIYRLKNASSEIASQIDKTRIFSLSNIKFNNQVVSGGWGIHFDINNNFYIIFADIDQSKDFNVDGSETFETIYLPDTLLISNLNPIQANALDIIFEPPNPKIYINTVEGINADITIQNINNDTKTITVNAVGGIDY